MNEKREAPKTKHATLSSRGHSVKKGQDASRPHEQEELLHTPVVSIEQDRDAERDETRDEERDKVRDTKRDQARDAGRDEERDSGRDEDRDEKRDEVRDALRDQTRDAERDEDRDAESAYDMTVGRGFESIRARKESGPTDERKRDESRDAKREESHDDAPLIVAMAEECMNLIRASASPTPAQPDSLQLEHLEWMCCRVVATADRWPKAKSHRWIGFILAGMISNRLLDLDDAKEILERIENIHPGIDHDLLDHLDPDNAFELDIGGEG